MLCEGVLVVAKDVNRKTGLCSGTRIGNWVFTHGTILIPFFDDNGGCINSSEYNLNKHLENLVDSNYSKISEVVDIKSLTFNVVTQNTTKNFGKINNTDGSSLKAKVERVLQYSSVRDALDSAIMSWESDVTDKKTELRVPLILSTLLLLKLTSDDTNKTGRLSESILVDVENSHVYRGMEILVESTPFNSISFFNSWSCGIVSNLLGPANSVLLLDARLTIGCEGAPIFV